MLNHAETIHSSTIVPLSVAPDQHQERPIDLIPSLFAAPGCSYAIGPVDPAQITTLSVPLSTDEMCFLLVPVQLPSAILTHPVFKEGYECGYLEGVPQEEEWTVPKLVNEAYHSLAELFSGEVEPDFCPWTLGFLLGELASVTERDHLLALSGLAHFRALLTFCPLESTLPWPLSCLLRARCLHHDALLIYRRRARTCREQGMSFAQAQYFALANASCW